MKQLGNDETKQRSIPMEVVNQDGSVSRDVDTVMDKWRKEFENLLNPSYAGGVEVRGLPVFEPDTRGLYGDEIMSSPITVNEICNALRRAKNGKAVGANGLPVESLRNHNAITVLHVMFSKCFNTGKVPTVWQRGIINPIPKSASADPRDPLCYRGITLASSIYKLLAAL